MDVLDGIVSSLTAALGCGSADDVLALLNNLHALLTAKPDPALARALPLYDATVCSIYLNHCGMLHRPVLFSCLGSKDDDVIEEAREVLSIVLFHHAPRDTIALNMV